MRFSQFGTSGFLSFVLALIKSIPCFTQWAYFLRWSKLQVKNKIFLLNSMVQLFSLLCILLLSNVFLCVFYIGSLAIHLELQYFWYRFAAILVMYLRLFFHSIKTLFFYSLTMVHPVLCVVPFQNGKTFPPSSK